MLRERKKNGPVVQIERRRWRRSGVKDGHSLLVFHSGLFRRPPDSRWKKTAIIFYIDTQSEKISLSLNESRRVEQIKYLSPF